MPGGSLEVRMMILFSFSEVGASKTVCFTGFEFLKHCVLHNGSKCILLCVFNIGASKTLYLTGVEFLKHCVLQGRVSETVCFTRARNRTH